MGDWFKNIELEGQKVKLIPLVESHKEELLKAAFDGKLWELWFTSVPSNETIDNYIKKASDDFKKETAYPFVVIDINSGALIGATRYCNAAFEHRRLEIGYTWYSKKYQRTGSLFQEHLKRIKIKNESYLKNLIVYINTNSSHHKIANYENYKYASYRGLISDKTSLVNRNEIFELFGGIKNFKYLHSLKKIKIELIRNMIFED